MRPLTSIELAQLSAGTKSNNSLLCTLAGGIAGMGMATYCTHPVYRIPAAYMGFICGAFVGGAGADIYYTIHSFTCSD